MNRFFCLPQEVLKQQIIIKNQEEIHHILDVLRQNRQDAVAVFDGSGKEYRGIIKEISKKQVIIDIASVVDLKEPTIKICLACAIPKKAKFDYIIQKVTELGVDEIIPLITERTIVKLDKENRRKKIERWQRICIEATKQCGRIRPPQIVNIFNFKEAISQIKEYDLAIISHLAKERKDIRSLDLSKVKKVIIFIGPEGDFSPSEIELALKLGCIPITLGRNVLRVDTAAIFSVGLLAFLLNKI